MPLETWMDCLLHGLLSFFFPADIVRQPWVRKLALIFFSIAATMPLSIVIGLVAPKDGKMIRNDMTVQSGCHFPFDLFGPYLCRNGKRVIAN